MTSVLRRVRAAVAEWRDGDRFVQPVATLASGTTAAYLLTYAARPVITRLFTAEAFGLFTFFTALTVVISTFSSGRYGDALMLPDTREDAINLLGLAGGLVLCTALLTAGLIPWRSELARMFGHPELAPWFLLLPPAVLATGWMQLAETWYTRTNEFRIISTARFVRSGSIAGLHIAGGFAGYAVGALIGGHVAGSLTAVALLLIVFLYHAGISIFRKIRRDKIIRQAKRYRRFVQYSTPAALLNNAISRLPVLLLLFFFSSDIIGYFGITYGTLAVPLGLVTGAIGQVFFVRAAEALRAKRLPDMTQHVHRRLIAIGMFPALAAVVAGPKLFAFVFGADWRMAGVFAQYLAPWIFLSSVASPLTRLFDVLERQRADLLFSLFMFVTLAAVLLTGGSTGTPTQTIIGFGIAGALVRILHILLLLKLTRVSTLILPRHLLRYAIVSIPFLGVVAGLNYATGPAVTFTGTVLVGLGYVGAVIMDDMRNHAAASAGLRNEQ